MIAGNPPSILTSPAPARVGQDGCRTPLRYEQYLASNHRPAFDGLRAIGFLLVVTAHIPAVPLFGYLQGWTAVWLFLVISGYLVTMLMVREEQSRGRVALGPFLIKRFCRIVPAYWLAIIVYLTACAAIPQFGDDFEDLVARLPYYLAFAPEYANQTAFNIFTHSWTVGIELKFYLLFPPVLFLMFRNTPWRFAVLAATAALLMADGSFMAQSYCALLFGALLALALEQRAGYAMAERLTNVSAVMPVALVLALAIVLQYTVQLTLVALVATYLVAYAIVQQARVSGFLTWRPLVYLGQRSYGAYLLHFLALRIGYLIFGGETTAGALLSAGFCLLVTVPAAALMYRAIERPAIEAGQRMLRRGPRNQPSLVKRSRSALLMTLTDDSDMASAPISGDSRIPNTG